MDEKEFINQVNLIEENKKLLDNNLKDLKNDYVKENCPVKIGDKIIANGYTFNGKTFMVDFVTVKKHWDDKYYFYACGPIIRKDGTEGSQDGKWYSNKENK